MKQKSMYTGKVKQADIDAGKKLVNGYKKWVGPEGEGYGIVKKEEKKECTTI